MSSEGVSSKLVEFLFWLNYPFKLLHNFIVCVHTDTDLTLALDFYK